MGREGEITTPGGLAFQLALKVAVAVGPARRFVVGDPEIQLIDVLAGSLDRPARRAPSTSRRRARSSSHGRRPRCARRSRRARRAARAAKTARPSASSRRLLVDVPVVHARSHAATPLPERARPPVAAAGGLRAPLDRPRRVPGRAPACVSRLRQLRRDRLRRRRVGEREARRVRARGAAHPRRLRRERAAADARRQGRLPLRRVRDAARARGRRRARLRRRARAARARGLDGRTRHPDRDHPRPAAQRHVRPRATAGRSSASATRSTSRPG